MSQLKTAGLVHKNLLAPSFLKKPSIPGPLNGPLMRQLTQPGNDVYMRLINMVRGRLSPQTPLKTAMDGCYQLGWEAAFLSQADGHEHR